MPLIFEAHPVQVKQPGARLEIIDVPWWKAPRTYLPPAERVRALTDVLARYRVSHHRDFIQWVAEKTGRFWEPQPPTGTTGREIQRRVRAEPSTLGQAMIQAEHHQTFRGGAIIPVGPHERRRPSPEIDYALCLWDRCLRDDLPAAMERYQCLAELLGAVSGTSDDLARAADRMRKRLSASALDDSDYQIARWRAAQDPAPYPVLVVEPAASGVKLVGWRPAGGSDGLPFPLPMAGHVIVEPDADGVRIELAPDTASMVRMGVPPEHLGGMVVAGIEELRKNAATWPPTEPVVVRLIVRPPANGAFSFEIWAELGCVAAGEWPSSATSTRRSGPSPTTPGNKGASGYTVTVALEPAPDGDAWVSVVRSKAPEQHVEALFKAVGTAVSECRRQHIWPSRTVEHFDLIVMRRPEKPLLVEVHHGFRRFAEFNQPLRA